MNLFDVYPLFDINIVKGKGCHVWDENGTEYLDLYGGHAVISIGHAHPHYVEMVSNQVATLGFYSNSVINKLQQQVAERLGKVCGYDDYSFFLINSGAEANENALKLASFYNGRTRVISFSKAFHGRTSLAVEVTNNPKIIAPINNCGHVTYLPLNDIEAMKAELSKGDVCAVIIEGIQGVGGIQLPTDEFMQALRQPCTEHNTVLILDEIQSGYGRSGKFFAHQYNGIKATSSPWQKASAMVSRWQAYSSANVYTSIRATWNHFRWKPPSLQCRPCRAGCDRAGKPDRECSPSRQLPDNGTKEIPSNQGRSRTRTHDRLEFEEPIKELRLRLLKEQHVFTGVSGTNVLRLLPPLCLGMDEAKEFLERFKKVL